MNINFSATAFNAHFSRLHVRCVICGRESEDILCGECAAERLRLAVLDTIEIVECSRCGSYRIGGRWRRVSFKEALEDAIFRNVRVAEGFRVRELKIGSSEVVFLGSFGGHSVEYRVPLSYRVRRATCQKCSRQSGGYYEAIVQLRAEGRKLSEEEIATAKKVIESILEAEAENEKAFLTKVQERREGIDFYLGSRDVGRKISYRISAELGGKVVESKKLHTRIDGRDVYRFTYLVRLPAYREGDIVATGRGLAVVKNVRLAKGVDISSGKTISVKGCPVVARREELQKGVVVNLDEHAAEVLCEDGNLAIVEKPYGADIGSEVLVFEHNGKFWAFCEL